MAYDRLRMERMFSEEFEKTRTLVTGKPGVYVIYDYDEIEYIGMSRNMASRCIDSIEERGLSRSATVSVAFLVTKNTTDAAILEIAAIAALKPSRNRQTFPEACSGEIRISFEKIDPVLVFDADLVSEWAREQAESADIPGEQYECYFTNPFS